jgi:Ca-activated chloride channel family protein
MIFEWPTLLWGWLVVPLLAVAYVRVQRRRSASMSGAARWGRPSALAPAPRLRRILPPTLYALALTLLIVAVARPMAVVSLPSLRDVIILALDVSHSMRADDLKPTRLKAAQQAARAFIEAQPATTRIGVVAFGGTALAVQRPTTNRDELLKAIDRLEPQKGTAVGEAMLVSLQALFPKELIELRPTAGGGAGADAGEEARPLSPEAARDTAPREPMPPGSNKSAAIVLLSDGAATGGPDPVEVARLAAERGVRVFTVGLGTEAGAVVQLEGISMRVQIDEEMLRKVADVTRARFFQAGDVEALQAIYRDVSARLVVETRETEISAGFVAAAALLALLAAGSSLFWFNRIL